jgi:hypothetical protein
MQSYLESSKDFKMQDLALSKLTFLSYYILFYISTIPHNCKYHYISVDEIYHFIQDLHSKLAFNVPSITKTDVNHYFSILDKIGVCNCLK